MEPVTADVSDGAPVLPRNHCDAAVIINGPLIPMNGQGSNSTVTLTNILETEQIDQPANHKAICIRQPSRQHLLPIQTSHSHQSLQIPSPSNIVTELPHLYWQSSPNHNHPHQFSIPNNPINSSLLPNNSPIFTTQSKITAPIKQKTRKDLNITRTQHLKKPARPDPILNQPDPNFKPNTPTSSLTRTDPNPASANPTHDNAVTMDSHTEKKRRREEKAQADNNDEDSHQHFLSAGPGSQDCREQ
ncbi:hypothetical protein P8452_76684 [Trifolium repens]|nr:hypothetical protein P8452_76684 [Trifolium repens]